MAHFVLEVIVVRLQVQYFSIELYAFPLTDLVITHILFRIHSFRGIQSVYQVVEFALDVHCYFDLCVTAGWSFHGLFDYFQLVL